MKGVASVFRFVLSFFFFNLPTLLAGVAVRPVCALVVMLVVGDAGAGAGCGGCRPVSWLLRCCWCCFWLFLVFGATAVSYFFCCWLLWVLLLSVWPLWLSFALLWSGGEGHETEPGEASFSGSFLLQ